MNRDEIIERLAEHAIWYSDGEELGVWQIVRFVKAEPHISGDEIRRLTIDVIMRVVDSGRGEFGDFRDQHFEAWPSATVRSRIEQAWTATDPEPVMYEIGWLIPELVD